MASTSSVIDMDGSDDFPPFQFNENSEGKHAAPGSSIGDYYDVGNLPVHMQDVSSTATPSTDSTGKTQWGNFLQQRLSENVSKMMWDAGKTQATKAWSIYGNIDLLRPYFDVEPYDVLKRLLSSLVPKVPTTKPIRLSTELYGPTMMVFTLIALLLFAMKSSGHQVREGTLMGTAFGTCFGYWIGVGMFVWFVAYLCNSHITYLQTLSLMGYAMFSHCIIVLLSTLIHTSHDHLFFYSIWTIFGGLSTLRMVSVLVSRTHGPSQKMVVAGTIGLLNMAFVLYLHFAFHEVVEDIEQLVHITIKPEVAATLNNAIV